MLDTHCIEAGNETLLRQAPMTAHDYMMKAISDIDELLGKGYAKQHPELIAAYMQTASIDFGAAVIARAIESVASALDNIERTLDNSATLFANAGTETTTTR